MRQPIKLVIKKSRIRHDGKCLVYLRYCHTSERRVLIGTGVAVPPIYWNRRTGKISQNLPPTFGNIEELEAGLSEQLRKAEDMVNFSIKKKKCCPIKFLKTNFSLTGNWKIEQMAENKDSLDVYRNIDLYIEERESEVKECTLNVIRTMKVHLQKFEEYRRKPITFDSFDFGNTLRLTIYKKHK